jgi:periplasmic protein TonB
MALKRSPEVLEFPRRARHTRHARWHAAITALDKRIANIERQLDDSGRPYSTSSNTRMRLPAALVASLSLHLLIIFSVSVKIPERLLANDRNSLLEVVLVNAKSKTKPERADVSAQHALDGGGNTDDARRAQSPLPVIPQQKPEPDVKMALRKVERLEREAQQLITQNKPAAAIETAPAPKAAAQVEDEPKPALKAADIMQRSLEVARLEAKISRDWDSYQQRPRKHFVGARAQEYRFARYVEDWRAKVERIGDLNYPQAAREQKLSGNLTVTVAIKADGTVDQIEINRPSGHRILDDAARRIVQLAAPFAPFPPDIAKDTDVLYITRRWTFTAADRFIAE